MTSNEWVARCALLAVLFLTPMRLPADEALTYQWQRNGIDIPGATSDIYTTPPTTMADNGARFRVRVSNSAGSVLSDEAVLTVLPVNQPPVVSAGPARTVKVNTWLSLVGTASDDGLPVPPGALTLQWRKVSGPGLVTFGTPTLATTTARFQKAGTYTLELAATDGVLSQQSTIVITVTKK
jgi:hypothetical protein